MPHIARHGHRVDAFGSAAVRRGRLDIPIVTQALPVTGGSVRSPDAAALEPAFLRVPTARSLPWTLLASPQDIGTPLFSLDEIRSHPGGGAAGPGASRAPGGLGKVALDKLVASIALVLAFPLMLVVAALVRMTDGGPAIYGHKRVGANGRTFSCYKFRTMVPNGDEVLRAHLAACPESAREWAATRKLRDDPRITRIGRYLRLSSLDELPQLINVLKGDMSCVGPRPVVADELAAYGAHVGDYLSTRPGITGLWQICGRSRVRYADRVKLDALYVRRWSLLLDLVILLKTIPAVVRTEDAA